jgi:hypothetical protein
MREKRKRTVASFFAQIEWQVAIAFALFLAALAGTYWIHRAGAGLPDPRQATYVLASIGAVLGLATSVAFGFVVFFLNHANSRKHDLYFKFKAGLFDFDKFLKEYPAGNVVVSESLALSWQLKFLKMSDFPILDWLERLAKVTDAVGAPVKINCGDPNVSNKVLGVLGCLEEIVHEIGILCVRQIVAGVHVQTVIKAFVTLGLLLLSLVLSNLLSGAIASAVASALPVLFATMAALILFEIGWYLHREADELLDFVEKDGNDNKP